MAIRTTFSAAARALSNPFVQMGGLYVAAALLGVAGFYALSNDDYAFQARPSPELNLTSFTMPDLSPPPPAHNLYLYTPHNARGPIPMKL